MIFIQCYYLLLFDYEIDYGSINIRKNVYLSCWNFAGKLNLSNHHYFEQNKMRIFASNKFIFHIFFSVVYNLFFDSNLNFILDL